MCFKTKIYSLSLSLLLLLTLGSARAEENIKVFGYFESQLTGLSNEYYQYNKLRLDIESRKIENVTFGANVNSITYNGKTNWDILDYIPSHLTQGTTPQIINMTDEIILDNAYLKMSFKYADLTIGKQQISLGTGYAWNPTDVFNAKDVFDPNYEQTGHNALRLDIPFSLKYSLAAFFAPEENLNTSGKVVRFKGKLGHFDYSLIGIEHQFVSNVLGTQELNNIVGADFAGELFSMGVWSEYAYNDKEVSEDYVEAVVGLDYTFKSGLYVLGEFFRNTSGKENYSDYTLTDWRQLISGEKKTLSQDNIFIFSSYPLTDLITGSCSGIISVNDESMAFVPSMEYSVFENVSLILMGNIYIGEEGKSFGLDAENGFLARIQVFF